MKNQELFKEKTGMTFESAYLSLNDRLTYYLNKIVYDIDMAKDLSIDTFSKALDKIDTFNSEKASFTTWLFTIGRNHALYQINLSKRMDIVSLDQTLSGGSTRLDYIEDTSDDLSMNDGEKLELSINIVLDAINELKEPYKSLIKMKDIDDLDYSEMQSITGMNINTMKTRVRSARNKIKESTKDNIRKLEDY